MQPDTTEPGKQSDAAPAPPIPVTPEQEPVTTDATINKNPPFNPETERRGIDNDPDDPLSS